MTFFETEKAMREKATKLPYFYVKGKYPDRAGVGTDTTSDFICHHRPSTAEYIVFCVNNMAKVSELLERCLDLTAHADFKNGNSHNGVDEGESLAFDCLNEIQAELEKLK